MSLSSLWSLLPLLTAFLSALLVAPAFIALAGTRGWTSRRDAGRAGPGGVAISGGLVLAVALAAGSGVALALDAVGFLSMVPIPIGEAARPVDPAPVHLWILGALLLLVVGYGAIGWWDDRKPRSPVVRLIAEGCVALLVSGLITTRTGSLGSSHAGSLLSDHALALVLPAAAIVAGANAFNLADNADGLAAGAGALTFAALSVAGVFLAPFFALAAAALAGFWFWNRPPARIYLGDHGALPLGGWMGLGLWFLIVRAWNSAAAGSIGPALCVALCAALCGGYLLWDPCWTVVRRIVRGRAPWVGGTDHPSHDWAAAFGAWPPALFLLLAWHGLSAATALAVVHDLAPAWLAPAAALGWLVILAGGALRGRPR
ncbi:MAG: hypothetical protein KA123_00810 [Candidatus Eisenbacteria bacterium]|nr:hypothetical protein [Candidatus Eisenbacteria bacterium]